MEIHRRHRYLLISLVGLFGVTLFTLIGLFMAADIVRWSWPEMVPGSCIAYVPDEPEVILSDGEAIEPTGATGTIYLTFDDGPGEYTAKLLDILRQYRVKATFFVTSAGDDELIGREYQDGHAIGLHTASHNYAYIYSNVDNFMADLDRVAERVKSITGQETRLMRFPGGSSNTVSRRYDHGARIMSELTQLVEERGYTYFDWNVASGDTDGLKSAEAVAERVINALKPGDNVVLQHDVKEYSVAAVPQIIEYGYKNGYTFRALDVQSFAAHHGVNN